MKHEEKKSLVFFEVVQIFCKIWEIISKKKNYKKIIKIIFIKIKLKKNLFKHKIEKLFLLYFHFQ